MSIVALRLEDGRYVRPENGARTLVRGAEEPWWFELLDEDGAHLLRAVEDGGFVTLERPSDRLVVGEDDRAVADLLRIVPDHSTGRFALAAGPSNPPPPEGEDAAAPGAPFTLGMLFELEPQTPVPAPAGCCCGPRDPAANWDTGTHWDLVDIAVGLVKKFDRDWAKQFITTFWDDLTFRESLQMGLKDADFDSRYTRPSLGPINYFANHFYNPDTGDNYMWKWPPAGFSKRTTAVTEGRRYGLLAADAGRRLLSSEKTTELRRSAGYNLGLALHFVTDLSQPMHAANFTNFFSWDGGYGTRIDGEEHRHSNFETYVERHRITLLADVPPLTDEHVDISAIKDFAALLHDVAVVSKKRFDGDFWRIIDAKSKSDEDWSDADADARASLLHGVRQVARFVRYWLEDVKRPFSLDPKRWYQFVDVDGGARLALVGGYYRRTGDTGGNSKMFALTNPDGTYSFACQDWMQNLWYFWTTSDVFYKDVTYLAEWKDATDRNHPGVHVRLLPERDGTVWIYDIVKNEAATGWFAPPYQDSGYVALRDPSDSHQRFRIDDAGSISDDDWRRIKEHWPS